MAYFENFEEMAEAKIHELTERVEALEKLLESHSKKISELEVDRDRFHSEIGELLEDK